MSIVLDCSFITWFWTMRLNINKRLHLGVDLHLLVGVEACRLAGSPELEVELAP
jgi:hypothetical protein